MIAESQNQHDDECFYIYGDEDDDIDELDFDDDNENEMDEYSYHLNVGTSDQQILRTIDSDGRFICGCGKTYKEERYMRYHKKWECGKLPTFQCPQCRYCAKRRNSLKQHMERRHPKCLFKKIQIP